MADAASGGKGLYLEEALKLYFWQAGYFAVRGVPYRIDDEVVTDIDLWLYERPAALTRRRLIVDAKNRRSPKAAERLIWTKGLEAALGVDGSIVATTDKRLSMRSLAKALNVTLFDGDAILKLTTSEQLKKLAQIRFEDFDNAVRQVDKSRRSTEWFQALNEAKTSLLVGIGARSANMNLAISGFFGEQATTSQPRSLPAQVALRLFYLTASFAAISLDYLSADLAFRSKDDQRQSIIASIRFGQTSLGDPVGTVRAALSLARKYLDSGSAGAKQIEYGFFADAERIPADIIADYLTQRSANDALFNVAREVERAAYSVKLPAFDELSTGARSLLGVFLDFNKISREKVARVWERESTTSASKESTTAPTRERTLFSGSRAEDNSSDSPSVDQE